MNEILDFLARYGTLLLFVVVFIEQLGLPLPAVPVLLAAGALVGQSKMNGFAAITMTTLASLLADIIWFWLGRVRGSSVLGFLCRISLEPDSCVQRTSVLFSRHGMRAVIGAKFIPGLGTVVPPLA